MLDAARAKAKPMSVALLGNVVDVLARRCSSAASRPMRSPTRPRPMTRSTAICRKAGRVERVGRAPRQRSRRAPARPRSARWRSTSRTCCASRPWDCRCSTTATTSARWRCDEGVERAFDFPGFVPAYIRPLFCRGIGPFRWVALSGDPEDIYKTDAKVKELIPDDPHLHHWLDMARSRIQFQGLPARICWVGLGQRHRLGLAFNEMVAQRRTLGADRHRPRSSGFRLGGQPEPRDRGDAGRLGCGLRLAAAQRAAQHRERRDLGLDPPRRRRRHGLLAACGRGHRAATARRPRAAACGACCGTIPAPASCAMPMPATRSPSTARASRA